MNDMSPDKEAAARREALEGAIRMGGGIVRFAKTMGVSLQAVTLWRKQRYVPLVRAVEIEQHYGIARECLVTRDVADALNTPRGPSHGLL